MITTTLCVHWRLLRTRPMEHTDLDAPLPAHFVTTGFNVQKWVLGKADESLVVEMFAR